MILEVLTIPSNTVSSSALPEQHAVMRDYVIGPENAVVVEAVIRPFLEASDVEFSPVFIHGPTGSGKSHLIETLSSLAEHGSITTDANALSAECTEALKIGEIDSFEKRYLHCKYLFLDDIDFLKDRPTTQQRFMRILEARSRAAKVTVITAKKPPMSLKLLHGLISRLSDGVVLPLEYPANSTRERLLKVFAKRTGISLDDDVICNLADQNDTAPALLSKLVAIRTGQADKNDLCKQSRKIDQRLNIDPNKLIRVTAKYYGLKSPDLSGSSRRKQHVIARSMAMYLLRQNTNLSFHDIGKLFGNRDHTTVIHACRKTAVLIDNEPSTEEAMSDILQRVDSRC